MAKTTISTIVTGLYSNHTCNRINRPIVCSNQKVLLAIAKHILISLNTYYLCSSKYAPWLMLLEERDYRILLCNNIVGVMISILGYVCPLHKNVRPSKLNSCISNSSICTYLREIRTAPIRIAIHRHDTDTKRSILSMRFSPRTCVESCVKSYTVRAQKIHACKQKKKHKNTVSTDLLVFKRA